MAANLNAQNPWTSPGKLKEVYEQFRGQLRRFFEVNARHPQSVDDLMQEMFLQLLKSRPTTELRDVQGYLYQTAWSVVNTAHRRARREPQHVLSCDAENIELHADRSNRLWVEDDTSTTIAQDQVAAALDQLPRLCQAAVLLRYRDGRSYEEIAAQLGCTKHTVKKYIMRALNQCRMQFDAGDPDDA